MTLAYIVKSIINIMLGIVGLLLGLRFILRLLSANPDNGFVSWIYENSAEVLEPFRNIFPTASLDGGFVIEFSTIFALLIYGLIGMLAFYIVDLITTPARKKR